MIRRPVEMPTGKGRHWTAALTSLRKCCWSACMRSIQLARAAEASMLMPAISPSPMQLASGSNAAVHCGRSWFRLSTAKYDPQRRHTATVAIATSPKCSRDFAGAFNIFGRFLQIREGLLVHSGLWG